MSILAFVLIFLSAGLHASWNLIAKTSHMTLPFYAVLDVVAVLMGLWIWFKLPFDLPVLTSAF